jgi:hypothetical protein
LFGELVMGRLGHLSARAKPQHQQDDRTALMRSCLFTLGRNDKTHHKVGCLVLHEKWVYSP